MPIRWRVSEREHPQKCHFLYFLERPLQQFCTTVQTVIRLKSYVSRQYLWTVRWGNSYTTTLLLEVFTQRNFVAYFIRLKYFNFIQSKSHFEPAFRGLAGNVRTRFNARWKTRGRLPIRHNWTFFAISYSWDVISRNLLKSAFLEGGSSVDIQQWASARGGSLSKFQTEGGVAHQLLLVSVNRVISISCGIKISAVNCLVFWQSTVWSTVGAFC